MKNLRYLLLLSIVMMFMPTKAQVIDENIEDKEEVKEDSAWTDSVKTDTASTNLLWPQSVQEKINRLLKNKMFQTSQVGMMVWDLTADSCIFEKNERQMMRPASCMKLLTAITAIDQLGGSYQFKTQLRYTGKIENHTLIGDVYLVGGMDPRFNSDDMSAFVSNLKEMGVDSIHGSIYADKSMKDDNQYGEGWCWDDDNPTLSPLLISRKDQFTDRFISKLREAKVIFSPFSAGIRRCPDSAYTVCTRYHSLDQILVRMLKESDNLYAESMYYQIAASTGNHPASAKSARAIERKLIEKIGLDPSHYRLADGSGLSLYNYITPELLVRLLRYAYQNDNIYMHLHPALPIMGVDGTLENRMHNAFTQGNVHAKTGTVTGVASLAGYCTAANSHILCFAIFNQGVLHAVNARAFEDRVCISLCSPQ